jgi:hypothetical protein
VREPLVWVRTNKVALLCHHHYHLSMQETRNILYYSGRHVTLGSRVKRFRAMWNQ